MNIHSGDARGGDLGSRIPWAGALAILGLSATLHAGELHKAAAAGDVARVEALVAKGTPVDVVDSGGYTPLRRAAFGGHVEVIRALVKAGAGVNQATGKTRDTALKGAVLGRQPAACMVLLELGADTWKTWVQDLVRNIRDIDEAAGLPKYEFILGKFKDPPVESIADGVADLGPAAGKKLVAWLGHENPRFRRCALRAASGAGKTDPAVTAALVKASQAKAPALRIAALRGLGSRRELSPAIVTALRTAVDAKSGAVRKEALVACTRLDWPKPELAGKELGAAIGDLRRALEARIRKTKFSRWRVIAAARALNGTGQLRVPGHIGGRAARIARSRTKRPSAAQEAIDRGLQWLSYHQDFDEDGKWDSDGFAKHDPPNDRTSGRGKALYDAGVTGLALLAFLGAGHAPDGESRYAKNVRRGLDYLRSVQDDDGCFGPKATSSFIYNHAIATLAMAEAWFLGGHPGDRSAARRGVEFLLKAQNPGLGWRYGSRPGDNSTSVTAWCVHALRVADQGGIRVKADAYKGARAWLEKMTDEDYGQVGYERSGGSSSRSEGTRKKFPTDEVYATTGMGIFCRVALGAPRRNPVIQRGAERCAQEPPRWNVGRGLIDKMYWYWGSLALHQVGGKVWRDWSKVSVPMMVKHQHGRGTGARGGSWDPIGPWGPDGGRVYATALMVLALETPTRYSRTWK